MKSRHLFVLVLMPLVAAEPAFSKMSPVCEDLRARLANVPAVIGTNPDVRKYSNAIAEQNLEMRKAQNDLRTYQCGSGSVVAVGGEDAAFCDELASSLARMRENIRYLSDMREEARAGGRGDGERQDLLSELDRNNCNDESGQSGMDLAPDPNAQAMQDTTFIPPGGNFAPQDPYANGAPAQVSTVCVRTCDGGFFPLTANATPMDFQRDAATCARMCPGIQTELFYNVLPTHETTDMVSTTTGAPYSQLPNAFVYRNRQPGEKTSCSCNLTAYYDEMRRKQTPVPQSAIPQSQGSITRIETTKPQKNTAAAAPAPITPPADRPYDPGRTVRQVGPQFLATDQGRIDLKNPAAAGPQPLQ